MGFCFDLRRGFLGVFQFFLKMSLLCATTRNLRILFAGSACSDTGWLGGPRAAWVHGFIICVLELCRLVVSSGNLIFFLPVPNFAALMTDFAKLSRCR